MESILISMADETSLESALVADEASLVVGPVGPGDENTFDEATADEVSK
jgi:hypothetical protein